MTKGNLILEPFKKIPLKTIEKQLRNTKLYSEKFIRSVIKGTSRSSVYTKDPNYQ